MKILVSYPLQYLRKEEFPDVVEYVLDIVAKHHPAELKIEGFYNLLVDKRPLLESFSDKSDSGTYRSEIVEDRKQRIQLIRAIVWHMKAANKAAIGTLADARSKVNPWVENHLSEITTRNIKAINRKTDDFLREYDENAELVPAATALGIHDYVENLKALQLSVKAKVDVRTAENAEKRALNRMNNKKELIAAIKNLFSAIDLARVEHTAIDYSPLINELSEILSTYHALVKSRNTRAKTSADKKETTAELSTTTSPAAI